jgi:hypothetical protein
MISHRACLAGCLATAALSASVAFAARPGGAPGPNLPASTAPTPARAVISEMPFQRFVQLTCRTPSTCTTMIGPVPAGERWALQFVSCVAAGSGDGVLRYFYLQVTDAKITRQLGFHYVAPQFAGQREPARYYAASQPVVLAVEPTNRLVFAAVAIGNLEAPSCAVSGVKQKLG